MTLRFLMRPRGWGMFGRLYVLVVPFEYDGGPLVVSDGCLWAYSGSGTLESVYLRDYCTNTGTGNLMLSLN